MGQVEENKEISTAFDPVPPLLLVATRFGIPALAAALSKSPQLLDQKLKESSDYKTPSLREAVAITRISGDRMLLEDWCSAEGGMFVELPAAHGDDEDVLDGLIEVTESLGKFARDLKDARADGVITPDEFKTQQRDAMRVHQYLQRLMVMIAGQVRDLPKTTGRP